MKKVVISAALLAASIGAQAAEPGPYVFGMGGMHLDKYKEQLKKGDTFENSVKSNAAYGELGVGYRLSEFLAAEASVYMNSAKKNEFQQTSNRTFGAKVGMLAMFPLSDRVDVYGKGSLNYGRLKSLDIAATGEGDKRNITSVEEQNKWKLMPSLGFGAIYHFNKNLAMRAEYEYTFGSKKSISEKGSYKGKKGLSFDSSRKNSQLVKIGLQYTF